MFTRRRSGRGCLYPPVNHTAMEESISERRKHKRFRPPKSSFVWLATDDSTVGQLIDMSIGGLGVRYIGDEFPNESQLDIFSVEYNFHVRQVPFKTVSNSVIYDKTLLRTDDGVHPSARTMRRSGVQFGELTDEQMSQVEYFIQNYTVGEV
jgi:hypothetical protein